MPLLLASPDSELTLPLFHFAADLAFRVRVFQRLSFIMKLFAAADANNHFHNASRREIHLEGNQRQAFLEGPTAQLLQLATMHQQFAVTPWLVIPETGLSIFGDIGSDHPKFTVDYSYIGLVERDFPFSKAFYLRADKNHSALDAFQDFEPVTGLSVFGDRFGLTDAWAGFFPGRFLTVGRFLLDFFSGHEQLS
jgi:hypothetical protein